MQITKARLKKIIQEELASLSEAKFDYRKVHASMLNLQDKNPEAVKSVGDQHRFVYTDGAGHHLVGLSTDREDKGVYQYGTYKIEDLTAAEKELEKQAAKVAEASIKQLRQIIREELEKTEKYTFNMYTKDGKPRVVNAYASSEEEARAIAGATFGAYFDPPGMDNDLDTDDDGRISVGELERELDDIKDDLEMEKFEVLLVKRHGTQVEKKRGHVDVNVAGHKTPRESKEAAKKAAAEKYPGYRASFAEFVKVGGLDANI